MWWVKGTPNLQTVEGKRKAATFIDKYITCAVPNAGEDDELRSLVLRLQKHSHTHTCRKDGRYRCRFDYPKNASDTTHLKRNIDVGNKARFYVLRRAQGAECVGLNLTSPAISNLIVPQDSCCVARVDINAVTRLFPLPHK